jgi:hypothetical protein
MKKTPSAKPRPVFPYKPLPHPQQYRLDEFRVIASLWTKGIK